MRWARRKGNVMSKAMSRRQFVGCAGGFLAAISAVSLAGCGSGSGSGKKAAGDGAKKVAVVCDTAGKNDGGYNQQAIEAAKKFCDEKGWELKVVEPTNGVPQALESLGEDGYSLVFNMEYDFEALVNGTGGSAPIAEQYPDTTWVVFNDNPNVDKDGKAKHDNVIAVLFNLNESSFVAGALSVLVNEHSKELFGEDYKFTAPDAGGRAMGFIGGTNSNGITVFSYGFIQGINYEAAKLGVTYDYYAKYDAGFSDSAAGSTVAGTYFGNGANVVFGAAGNVGDGITAKAKEVGKLAIQVDANKDAQQPGYVLTSVLKSTDVPVFDILKSFADGKVADLGAVVNFPLATGATDITDLATISEYVSESGKAKWEEIKTEVEDLRGKVGKEIDVVNAQADEQLDPSSCPNVTIK